MHLSADRFQPVQLDADHVIYTTSLRDDLSFSEHEFDRLWDLHPAEYHTLNIMGREVKTPRWQQAYGRDYRYTGSKNNALPIGPELRPFYDWCRTHVDPRMNGLLLNWYDGENNHYIGAHRDDTRDLQNGSAIITISLGEERVFRMRPWRQKGKVDVPLANGDAIVIPWATNRTWTHEVPHFNKYRGRRISITLRAYLDT